MKKLAALFLAFALLIMFSTPSMLFATSEEDIPFKVFTGEDVKVEISIQIKDEDRSYNNVKFKFKASGPGNVTFEGTDFEGNPYKVTNEGYWGPEDGFELPMGETYNNIFNWILNFNKPGLYTVEYRLFDENLNEVVCGIEIVHMVEVRNKPVPPPVYPINKQPLDRYKNNCSDGSMFFYHRILGREPDPEGMENWVAAVKKGIITGPDMVYHFIFSNECQSIISDYNNEEFITFLYGALFNREPDEKGFQSWISALEGGLSRKELVRCFVRSEEFMEICNYFNIVTNQIN